MKIKIRQHKALLFILTLSIFCFVAVMLFLKYIDYNLDIPQIQATPNKISAAIVPFDPAARQKRQNLLQQISTNSYQTIIVVAPTGIDSAITADELQKIPNSVINLDDSKIETLTQTGQVSINNDLFDETQAFIDLAADVNNFFPDPTVLPILIPNNFSSGEVTNLVANLSRISPRSTLMVLAVNFASNVPSSVAEIQNSHSVRSLGSFDKEEILKSDIGSPAAALLAAEWAKLHFSGNFHLFEAFALAEKYNDPDSKTDSFITGWFEENGQAADKSFDFIIGGDMMFDRLVSYRFPKEKLVDSVGNLGGNLFRGMDLSMINLEGPISPTYQVANTLPSNMTFSFPPKTVDVLKYLHINAASLANNHSLNGGAEMLAYTKLILSQNKIVAIGDQTQVGMSTFGKSKKLTVIAIDTFGNSTNLTSQIEKAKARGEKVLVFPHWGSEYQTTHSLSQEKLAHQWIDAGADIIIGSHPHVVQDAEMYKGKPIFYSLGNLLFDQTFSLETQQGLIIAGKITDEKLTLVLVPTVQKNLKPELMRGDERYQIVAKLKSDLGLGPSGKSYGYDKIELDRQ